MSDEQCFSILAGGLYIGGYVLYIRSILRGRTSYIDPSRLWRDPASADFANVEAGRPSLSSWLIWAVLDSIICATMFVKHTLNGQMIGAVIGSWIVVFLALKYGKPGWTTLDKFCLGGAALGICVWRILDSTVLALLMSLVVMLIGSFPTVVSAREDPSREDRNAWALYWLSCVCALLAIPKWTIMDAAQPIVFTAIECVMMYILWIRPRNTQIPFDLMRLQIPRPPRVPRRIILCQQCREIFCDEDAESLAEHTCPPEYRSDVLH